MDDSVNLLPLPADAHGPPSDASSTLWLSHLVFSKSAPPALKLAAQAGDLRAFSEALQTGLREQSWKKGKRNRLLKHLQCLWPRAGEALSGEIDPASLAHCLFDADLNEDELSGRVEAIITGQTSETPDPQTVLAALWMLRSSVNRLDPQTLVSLWRWTLEACLISPVSQAKEEAPSGFEGLNRLEILWLAGETFREMKAFSKASRKAAHGVLPALDAATDSDGTPHARVLADVVPTLALLARLKLFAASCEARPWGHKAEKRIAGLFRRTAVLLSTPHLPFQATSTAVPEEMLRSIGHILEQERPQSQIAAGKHKNTFSRQSDWAEWATLHDAGGGSTDQLLVRYHQSMPEVDLVAADHPLFRGNWSHTLKIDNETVPIVEDWTCVCWYADKSASFIELEQKSGESVRMIRQALLLRRESVLLLADSIRTESPGLLEFSRSVPLCPGWQHEEDSETRELALTQEKQRVRVFPLSTPQLKVHRSEEQTSLRDRLLTVTSNARGPNLYVATLFDWNPKRREAPVEWTRLTVAEDGVSVHPTVAAGHRLRIGKLQWLLYHSFAAPRFPRSVLGLHTGSETVFARVDSSGEYETLVEVEL
ncbi:hypothetical protein [Planctomicrobium sp. SH664]|uniref:hypothetical protein n=1 Tax=Planctomicrobium sp. SH664 TaxID=3448125 RepID=UPI003F5B2FC0